MKSTALLLALVLLSAFSATSFAQNYKYDLHVEETQVLRVGWRSAELIPVDEQRPTKKYDCELTIATTPSTQEFSGVLEKHASSSIHWNFQAKEKVTTSVQCFGADNGRRLEMTSTYYFKGDYEKIYSGYIDGRSYRNVEKFPDHCVSIETPTLPPSRPKIPIPNDCKPFDPQATQVYRGETLAKFVATSNPKGYYTATQLKLENGKISGYSDEILFSGTYQLK